MTPLFFTLEKLPITDLCAFFLYISPGKLFQCFSCDKTQAKLARITAYLLSENLPFVCKNEISVAEAVEGDTNEETWAMFKWARRRFRRVGNAHWPEEPKAMQFDMNSG